MKTKHILVTLCLCMTLFAFASVQAQEPLFYLDFDENTIPAYSSGDIYFHSVWWERATSATAIYIESLNGDGVEIKVPDGDGTSAPDAEGPQGGQALHIDAGDVELEEGLNVELSSNYPTGDYTVECTFWMSTNNNTENIHPDAGAIGIQNIWSSSWPCQDVLHMELRNVGNASIVGRPADSQKLEIAAWEGDGSENRVVSTNIISAPGWHTAQVTFDYNESDPANCSFALYLDGTAQGASYYDATKSAMITAAGCTRVSSFTHAWGAWGTPAANTHSCREGIGTYRFLIGMSTSHLVSGTDNRGLDGAIDAFCISAGVLDPGDFVLPGGFNPPPPTSVNSSWNLYR